MTELKEEVFENRGKLDDETMAKYKLTSLENISKDLVKFAGGLSLGMPTLGELTIRSGLERWTFRSFGFEDPWSLNG